MTKLLHFSSLFVLFVVTALLGFMGKHVEMALAAVAGLIGLGFAHIDLILARPVVRRVLGR